MSNNTRWFAQGYHLSMLLAEKLIALPIYQVSVWLMPIPVAGHTLCLSQPFAGHVIGEPEMFQDRCHKRYIFKHKPQTVSVPLHCGPDNQTACFNRTRRVVAGSYLSIPHFLAGKCIAMLD